MRRFVLGMWRKSWEGLLNNPPIPKTKQFFFFSGAKVCLPTMLKKALNKLNLPRRQIEYGAPESRNNKKRALGVSLYRRMLHHFVLGWQLQGWVNILLYQCFVKSCSVFIREHKNTEPAKWNLILGKLICMIPPKGTLMLNDMHLCSEKKKDFVTLIYDSRKCNARKIEKVISGIHISFQSQKDEHNIFTQNGVPAVGVVLRDCVIAL